MICIKIVSFLHNFLLQWFLYVEEDWLTITKDCWRLKSLHDKWFCVLMMKQLFVGINIILCHFIRGFFCRQSLERNQECFKLLNQQKKPLILTKKWSLMRNTFTTAWYPVCLITGRVKLSVYCQIFYGKISAH